MIASKNEGTFKEASQFKPERWMDHMEDPVKKPLSGSSIVQPFGIGKRICPGKKFIEQELTTIMSKVSFDFFCNNSKLIDWFSSFQLVKEFEIEYVSPFELSFEFVLAPKGPVNIRFCDRTWKYINLVKCLGN